MPGMATTHPTPSGPSLFLIDQENLTGMSPRSLRSNDIVHLSRAIQRRIRRHGHDLVAVASNPGWRRPLEKTWPCGVVLSRAGRDGADKALCEFATAERLQGFSRLVVVSGDGRLAGPARLAQQMGLHITVVARPACLSRSLERIADDVLAFRWEKPHAPERSAA